MIERRCRDVFSEGSRYRNRVKSRLNALCVECLKRFDVVENAVEMASHRLALFGCQREPREPRHMLNLFRGYPRHGGEGYQSHRFAAAPVDR